MAAAVDNSFHSRHTDAHKEPLDDARKGADQEPVVGTFDCYLDSTLGLAAVAAAVVGG